MYGFLDASARNRIYCRFNWEDSSTIILTC